AAVLPLWQRGTAWAALLFFFSSSRRHTRSKRDWSSDVCSSDLFFPSVYPKFESKLASVNLTPDYGIGAILDGLHKLDGGTASAVKAAIERDLADGPALYMVNSDKGITNLHVPSDVIVDASMPALIRNGGKGWGPSDEE